MSDDVGAQCIAPPSRQTATVPGAISDGSAEPPTLQPSRTLNTAKTTRARGNSMKTQDTGRSSNRKEFLGNFPWLIQGSIWAGVDRWSRLRNVAAFQPRGMGDPISPFSSDHR